jgi:hypothetical protein
MDKKPDIITFYILWQGNTEEHCEKEMNQIGVDYELDNRKIEIVNPQTNYTDKEKLLTGRNIP